MIVKAMNAQARLPKKSIWLPLIFLAIAALPIMGCLTTSDSTSQEERAVRLDKRLICPVCPGETIDQSQVEIAKQMRTIVREKLAEGASDEEVLNFFVDRYGDFVLAQPPKEGFNLIAWIVPPLVLILGGGALFFIVREMRKRKPEEALLAEHISEEGLEPYLSEVDQELKALDYSIEPEKSDS